MQMKRKEPNLLLSFHNNVLTNLMHELMPRFNRQIPIDNSDHTVFMVLGNPSFDVHLTSGTAEKTTLLDDHPGGAIGSG
jgi:hypothetical protein